jgi:nicotinic acid mononucleotide adenylyltransferase
LLFFVLLSFFAKLQIINFPDQNFKSLLLAASPANYFVTKIGTGAYFKINSPTIELSSTFIRENVKLGKNVQPLLPNKVWESVEHNIFYKK